MFVILSRMKRRRKIAWGLFLFRGKRLEIYTRLLYMDLWMEYKCILEILREGIIMI